MGARKKLGELLVEAGVVSDDDLRAALGQQQAAGAAKKIGQVLIDTRGVTPKAVAHALARQFELPFVELPVIPAKVSERVPREIQLQHRIVPFRVEKDGMTERLHVAVADPADLTALDQLRFTLRNTLRVHVAATDDLEHALAVLRGEVEAAEPEPIALSPEDEEPEAEFEVVRPPAGPVTGGWFGPVPPLAPEESGAAAVRPARPEPGIAIADANVTATELDDLLGGRPPSPPELTVLKFDGAKVSARSASQRGERLDFDDTDLQVLETLEKLSEGHDPGVEGEKVRPERMVAALIRLLIRKGVIQELEFLDELARK